MNKGCEWQNHRGDKRLTELGHGLFSSVSLFQVDRAYFGQTPPTDQCTSSDSAVIS